MLDENPYKASGTTESVSSGFASRARVVLWWLIYLHPVITLALIYACWALTVVSLGRPPRLNEHSSQSAVQSAVHVLGNLAAVSLLAGLVLIPIGIVWSVVQPFARRRVAGVTVVRRLACPCAYTVMLVICVCIWAYDPFGTVYWFID